MEEIKDRTTEIQDATPIEIEVDASEIAQVISAESHSAGSAETKPESAGEGPKKKGLSDDAKEWIRDLLAAVIIAALVLQFIMPTVVREHSMENTLQNNDYLFVSKQAYKLFGGTPSRGDVIVFQSDLPLTANQNKLLVKRIIAVGGDTIYIKDGITYVNGTALDEPFTKDGYTRGDMDPVSVPEGYLFCMGDNRQNSGDSRDPRIGLVDVKTLKGKVVFRLFPFSEFGKIESYDISGQLQK